MEPEFNPNPNPTSKPIQSRPRLNKDVMKYLYLIKAETLKPLSEIIAVIVTMVYEDEELRRRVIERLSK